MRLIRRGLSDSTQKEFSQMKRQEDKELWITYKRLQRHLDGIFKGIHC